MRTLKTEFLVYCHFQYKKKIYQFESISFRDTKHSSESIWSLICSNTSNIVRMIRYRLLYRDVLEKNSYLMRGRDDAKISEILITSRNIVWDYVRTDENEIRILWSRWSFIFKDFSLTVSRRRKKDDQRWHSDNDHYSYLIDNWP